MKYLTFIRSSESQRAAPPPPELMEAMSSFVEKSRRDGTLIDTGGLLPSKEGVRVRLAGGKITVTDGPFAETKEVIGGWAIVNVDSKAEAIRVATEFMELHRKHWSGFEGESEVRLMFEPDMGRNECFRDELPE
ncbi:MAG TPA: YciI family protein [Woeseiaceae bacterium]|nr:YciI family protein [Woeseiaceae bacterium]